jgi:hypothetical protein
LDGFVTASESIFSFDAWQPAIIFFTLKESYPYCGYAHYLLHHSEDPRTQNRTKVSLKKISILFCKKKIDFDPICGFCESETLLIFFNKCLKLKKINAFQICPSGVTNLFVTGSSVFPIHREEFLLGGHDRSVASPKSSVRWLSVTRMIHGHSVSAPMMVVTQKVTSLAYSLHDGSVEDKDKLKPMQTYHAVR